MATRRATVNMEVKKVTETKKKLTEFAHDTYVCNFLREFHSIVVTDFVERDSSTQNALLGSIDTLLQQKQLRS
jgi:hypothetical protein